jgi:regulator of protease activity HflC (stomatin/prohibitin superfamily)
MFFILPEWEAMVVLRLGKFDGVRGAGFFVIPPFIYSVASIVDMRIETHQVEATATLTKDNVATKVTAALEFKVEDARKATMDVQNYRLSVTWLSTEALKNTIGSLDLKELLSDRERIAEQLKIQIDQGAATYGVDIRAVRITDIDTPQQLMDELAAIARAKRSAEAKQIEAEAEVLVAEKIAEASVKMENSQYGMRLRELQILNAMSKEQGSMVIIYPYGDRNGAEIAHNAAGHKQ